MPFLEQTTFIFLYSMNRLFFVAEKQCFSYHVGSEPFNTPYTNVRETESPPTLLAISLLPASHSKQVHFVSFFFIFESCTLPQSYLYRYEKWALIGDFHIFKNFCFPAITVVSPHKNSNAQFIFPFFPPYSCLHHLKSTGYVMHHQFNIQQLYDLPTLCLCVLYLSENKQRLVPLTA